MSCLVNYNLCFSFSFFNHGVFSSFLIKECVCASGIFRLSLINQDNTVVLSQGRFHWFLKWRVTRGFKPYVPIQSIDRSKKVGSNTRYIPSGCISFHLWMNNGMDSCDLSTPNYILYTPRESMLIVLIKDQNVFNL